MKIINQNLGRVCRGGCWLCVAVCAVRPLAVCSGDAESAVAEQPREPSSPSTQYLRVLLSACRAQPGLFDRSKLSAGVAGWGCVACARSASYGRPARLPILRHGGHFTDCRTLSGPPTPHAPSPLSSLTRSLPLSGRDKGSGSHLDPRF